MDILNQEQIEAIFKRLDEKMIDPATVKAVQENGETVCLGCGCSDMCACEGGCYWVDVDPTSGFGICSSASCRELLGHYGGDVAAESEPVITVDLDVPGQIIGDERWKDPEYVCEHCGELKETIGAAACPDCLGYTHEV